MWLSDCYRMFGETTLRFEGRRQDLSAVEADVAKIGAAGVTREVLRTIELSAAWTYPQWWPRLSERLATPVALPDGRVTDPVAQKAIRDLYEQLKHIEVVSVALRFLRPQAFAIISPPVTALLNLPPADGHVQQYLEYIATLAGFVEHYRELDRVADVDMALWTAARLSFLPEHAALCSAMCSDEYFQEVRLRNLTRSFPREQPDDRRRLIFASVLVSHDHSTGALIAGRVYEGLVRSIGARLGLPPSPRNKQSEVGALVYQLDRTRAPEIEHFGVAPGDLVRWWKWRNQAVHSDPPLGKAEAVAFVRDMRGLNDRLEMTDGRAVSGRR
jgi:hypothetical protein